MKWGNLSGASLGEGPGFRAPHLPASERALLSVDSGTRPLVELLEDSGRVSPLQTYCKLVISSF